MLWAGRNYEVEVKNKQKLEMSQNSLHSSQLVTCWCFGLCSWHPPPTLRAPFGDAKSLPHKRPAPCASWFDTQSILLWLQSGKKRLGLENDLWHFTCVSGEKWTPVSWVTVEHVTFFIFFFDKVGMRTSCLKINICRIWGFLFLPFPSEGPAWCRGWAFHLTWVCLMWKASNILIFFFFFKITFFDLKNGWPSLL